MRRLSLIRASSTAAVTVRSYKGEEHLVVPFVVMVGDSVVRPMGSEGPEFVPSDVLSFAPEIWNGTNVVLDHPNGAATACDPLTLERTQFGTAFNSRFKNGALQIDLWLSPSRAQVVGPEAVKIIDKCRAGEKVEVSFAPYMVVQEEEGISPSGVPYEYRVQAIVGADHIAALPEGTVGACSVEMGCGGPAIMKGLQMNKVGKTGSNQNQNQSLFKRLMASFSSLLRSEADVGDLDLWIRIAEALRSTEVNYQNIEEIFHDSDTTGRVIYSTGDWQSNSLWQREFSIDVDGVITLSADRTEVKKDPATYSPVTIPDTPSVEIIVAAGHEECQCQGSRKELAGMNKKKELVTKLMAAGKFKQSALETMSEEALEGMVNAVETATPSTETVTAMPATDASTTNVTTASTTAPSVTITRDQALAAIGITEEQLASMQTAAIAYTTQLNVHKAQLVSHLSTAQTQFNQTDLQSMSVEVLEKLTRTLQAASGQAQADYSFSRVDIRPNTEKKYTPPDPHGVNKYIYPTEN